MIRTTRAAARTAVGALTLAVALGAGTASAAPHATQGSHTHAGHAAASQHGQRQVLVRIAVLDARLLRAAKESRTAGVDADAAARLVANVAADRESLSLLAAGVMENPATNLAVARETLRSLRVANYVEVVNILRQVQRLSAKVAEAQTVLASEPAAPLTDLEAAAAALAAVVVAAGDITGFSDKQDVRALRSGIAAAQAAVEAAEAYLASPEPAPDMG